MKCKIRLKLSQLGCSWQLGLNWAWQYMNKSWTNLGGVIKKEWTIHKQYKIATKVCDFWLYLKIATKVRDFCSKLHQRVQGFLPRFLPPWPLKSCPAARSNKGSRLVMDPLGVSSCVWVPWYAFCSLECKNKANITNFFCGASLPPPCLIKDSQTSVWWELTRN